MARGFLHDTTRTRRHYKRLYPFQRARHHANANELVYFIAPSSSDIATNENNNQMEHLNDNLFRKETKRTATKIAMRTTSSSETGPASAEKRPREESSFLTSKKEERVKIGTNGDRREDNLHQVRWNAQFNQLVKYKQQFGDCLVPGRFKENPQLGLWVITQRRSYIQEPKTISDERIQLLEEIGFEWCAQKSQWELRFWQLVEYKHQYGHCMVPSKFPDNPQLGNWVQVQRESYKNERKTMSVDRIQRLEELGFEWGVNAQWELRFQQLTEYRQQFGDCWVPQGFEANPQLGTWVAHQRQQYKQEPKAISDDRIKRLEDIAFEWGVRRKSRWELRFQQLIDYKQQYGDCLVPSEFQENPQLGVWVKDQRKMYKREPKMISDDRVRRLEEIGFEWEVLKAQWELRFQQLVEYRQQYGDCLVPNLFEENPQLGCWVSVQRIQYKREPKTITDERIQRLEEIGFEWEVHLKTYYKPQWESRFQQLVEYKQRHGDCLVLDVFQENPQLGHWVKTQRQLNKRVPKRISFDRIQRLDDIGFEWDVPKAQWERMYQQLVQYKQQYGDCWAALKFPENSQLKKWISQQRQSYKKAPKQISDDRVHRLENIGFEWDDYVDAKWDLRFKQLVEYMQHHGDCLVPAEFEENPQLAVWVRNQRQRYKNEPRTISNDRIERLDDIGFEWEVLKAQWDFVFAQLVEYKQQHGDCLVPNPFKENPQLGFWVAKQRDYYRRVPKQISNDRIQRLEAIGFEWVGRSRWQVRFEELVEYKYEFGNCLVPPWYDRKLAEWANGQRAFYKDVPKLIRAGRIRQLDDIGFEWDIDKAGLAAP